MDGGSNAAAGNLRARRTRRVRSQRRLRVGLAVLLLPPAIAVGASQTPWGEERLATLAEGLLRDELGLETELEGLKVGWGAWPPSLTLRAEGIELRHPTAGPFIEADALMLRPSLGAVLVGQIDLQTIELTRPSVRLVVTEDGLANGPTLAESEGGPPALPFERLRIEGGVVAVEAEPLGTARLEGLELDLAASSGSEGLELDLVLDAVGGALSHAEGIEPVQRLHATARVNVGEDALLVDADRFVFRTPYAAVTLEDATLAKEGEGPLRYAGHTATRIELARLARLPLPVELPPLEGTLRVEGDLSGDDAGVPSGEGRVVLERGRLLRRFVLGNRVDLQVRADSEGVEVLEGSEVFLPSGGGRASLEGRIGLAEGFPLDVTLGLEDATLASIMEAVGSNPEILTHWPMTGRARLVGTLLPLAMGGPVDLVTEGFLVTEDTHHVRPRRPVLAVPRATLRGRWDFDEDALAFSRLVVESARSRLEVPVLRLSYEDNFEVLVRSERFDLEDVSPLLDDIALAGRGALDVKVVGTYDAPRISGRTSLAGFAFDGLPGGDVTSDFELLPGYQSVLFPLVEATKNESRYRVHDLLLGFGASRFRLQGELELQRVTLADTYHALQIHEDERFTDVQGVARGRMSLDYSRGAPEDGPNGTFLTRMDLTLPALEVSGVGFTDGRLSGRFRWEDYTQGLDGGELDLEHLELRKGGGRASVEGRIAVGGATRLTVTADHLALGELEKLEGSGIAGSYAVLGEVRGTTAVPRAHFDVALTGVRQGETSLGDGRLYVRLTDRQDPWVREARDWDTVPAGAPCGHARAGFARGRWRPARPLRTSEGPVPAHVTPMAYLVCGEGLGGALAVDLAFGWTDEYPVRGVVALRDLRLDRFAPDPRLGGAVDGRLTLTKGSLLAPETLEGALRLGTLRLVARNERGATQVALESEAPVEVALTDGGFLVEQVRLGGDGAALRVEGGGSSRGDLGLRVAGDVDLGLLARVSDDVRRSAGALRFRVRLTGKVSDPAVFGDVVVRGGSAEGEGLPASLDDMNGRLTFSERRILVERLDAELAGGSLAIAGGASIAEGALERYGFDVSLRNATLTPEDGVLVALGADAALSWQKGQRLPLLAGEVELRRARYERRIDVSPTLGQLYRPQRAEVERYDPQADNVEIDLRITDRSPLRIRNNLFDLDLRIDEAERPFRIVGTDQRYGILGNVRIPRGVVRFRGTEFDVTTGDVRFDDASRVDPRFVVLAQTEIRRQQTSEDLTGVAWQIRLRAEGTMDGFRLDASSNPQLSQEDLALLLTVGLTSAEAQQLQAGDVGGTALEALSALTGVNDEVRDAVQVIDEFAITTRYSPDTGRPEPMVTVGKRITDRVRVSASTGLTGEERTFTTGVEWRLGDESSVQVSYDNINRESNSRIGNIGVDFHWRLEFE